jgi:hypothetical protein
VCVSHLIISQEEVRIKTVSIILIVLTEELRYIANKKRGSYYMRHNKVTFKIFHLFLKFYFVILMLDGICKIKLYIASFHTLCVGLTFAKLSYTLLRFTHYANKKYLKM